MAYLNEQTQELHLKVLYVGASQCGKTTNIQSLFKQTSQEVRTRYFDLHSLRKETLLFDFLPLSYGEIKNHALRLHLYTVPHHEVWPGVMRGLFHGVDGVIFVVDSRLKQIEENERLLHQLKIWLGWGGRQWGDMPLVFQYNFRDSPDILDLPSLKLAFSRHNASFVEAVAVQDIGVFETLDAVTDKILFAMESSPGMMDRIGLGL